MARKERENAARPGWLSAAVATSVLSVLLLSVYRLAENVAKFGYSDPDTCWLLAVGRYIVEHRFLPATDPFSYTLPAVASGGGKPFIVYQWLSEVFFYLSSQCADLVGPLVLVALVLANTFVVVPLIIARKLQCPHLLSLALVSLSTLAVFPRFFVRPEIFSNLFLVLWLVLLALLRLRRLGRGKEAAAQAQSSQASRPSALEWRLIACAVVLMFLWCNFHCCFVLGLLLLVAYLICATVETIMPGSTEKSPPLTEWVILLLAAMASLVNPWGVRLWTYLPVIFFSPVNSLIKELQPFSGRDFEHPYYYPFLALTLSCCCLMAVRIAWASKNKKFLESIGLFAPLVMVAAVIEAITCKRAVAFATAILAVELLLCWRRVETSMPGIPAKLAGKTGSKKKRAKVSTSAPPLSLAGELEKQLEKIYGGQHWLWLGAINVVTVLVVVVYCLIYPQSMPQARSDFRPPLKALRYISENAPKGRMFNSTLFGDVLIWYLKGNPQVFIDTRFDLYAPQPANDYADIFFCHPGWRELLTKYAIDWIFVPPNCILAHELANDSAWQKLYGDQEAVILGHKGSR